MVGVIEVTCPQLPQDGRQPDGGGSEGRGPHGRGGQRRAPASLRRRLDSAATLASYPRQGALPGAYCPCII